MIAHLRSFPDEDAKAESLERPEKAIAEIPPEVLAVVEGMDDVKDAMKRYRDIKPEGLTHEEYKQEKEAAWADIESNLEELEVLEEQPGTPSLSAQSLSATPLRYALPLSPALSLL